MPRFRRRPIVIEAEQFAPGDGVKHGDVFEAHGQRFDVLFHASVGPMIQVNTPNGQVVATYGDWIIKDVEGNLYPCVNSVFEKSYDDLDALCNCSYKERRAAATFPNEWVTHTRWCRTTRLAAEADEQTRGAVKS